jgi:hypothetical protein
MVDNQSYHSGVVPAIVVSVDCAFIIKVAGMVERGAPDT